MSRIQYPNLKVPEHQDCSSTTMQYWTLRWQLESWSWRFWKSSANYQWNTSKPSHKQKKLTLEHSVDPEDVAEIMLSLIDQEKRKYWREGGEAEVSQSKAEEEYKRDEEIEKETQPKSPEWEDDEKEKQVKPKKHKAVIDIEESEEVSQEGETEPAESEEIVKPKKRKAVIAKEEQSKTEESEEVSQEGETEPKQTPSFNHHLNRKCVAGHGCTYEGPNLKRHLKNVHVKRHHILKNQIDRYFAIRLNHSPPC